MGRGTSDLAMRICLQTLAAAVDVAETNIEFIRLLAEVAEAVSFNSFADSIIVLRWNLVLFRSGNWG